MEAPPQFAPAPQFGPAQFAPVPQGQPDPAYQPGSAAVPVAAPVSGYGPMGAYPGGPVPPTYDPAAMAQQYSAPPTSGPYGYGMPMMSGIPMQPPPKRSRVGVAILSVLMALFLVASGVLGTLFVMKNKEADKLTAQVTQLNSDVSTANTKAEGLQRELDAAKRDLTDSKGQTDEVTTQKKAIADCINALYDYFAELDKANGVSTAAVKAKETDLDKKCDEADKYL
jgi:outer membrane murein-binding lipoprotein Lpp